MRGGFKSQTEKRSLLSELCMKQDWRCFWCGRVMSQDSTSLLFRTVEHILPLSNGGSKVKDRSNVRAACRECNELRGKWTNVGQLVRERNRFEELYRSTLKTIHRHKTTMAGRCYWCRFKFHLKEWLYRRKEAKNA